jgi:hypothetical protein
MMTLNVFYRAGRVTRIRSGQDGTGFDFELAIGRGVRICCRLSHRLTQKLTENRLNGFRRGDWLYVFGPLCPEPGDGVFVKVVFLRLLRPRRADGEAVIEFARSNGGRVTRREVAARLGLSAYQAAYILARLVRAGRLRRAGKGRGVQYELAA